MKPALLAVLVVAMLGAGGWWWWSNTPTYAVQQAKEALKDHDQARFHNWVDVHAVASAAVDDLLSEPMRSAGSGVLERVVGVAIVAIFKPTVVEAMDKQIDTWVAHKPAAGSNEDEEQDSASPPKSLLGALVAVVKPPSLKEVFADYGLTKQNYRGLGSSDSSDHLAHVGLRFFSPKAQREVEIQLELNNGSGHWQVVRLSNLQQVVPVLAGG